MPHSCREFFGNPPTFAGGNHDPPSLSLLGFPDKSRFRFSKLNTYNMHTFNSRYLGTPGDASRA